MSDEPVALALKFGFLAVLYLFLLWVARSSLRDLRREAAGSSFDEMVDSPTEAVKRGGRESKGPDLSAGVEPRLEVVAAMNHEAGEQLVIGDGATLGRSDGADVQVEDPFASSAHARIFARGQFMFIEDMGSTNGTYLNGRPLRRAEQLKVADTIRIGDTEYRYQE
ncbi:MAG: FHA domain-containing protein [Thermoleophilaceae bacterium]|nr:FHA domain-containing protein [Thermoleophilaceae bacterium]